MIRILIALILITSPLHSQVTDEKYNRCVDRYNECHNKVKTCSEALNKCDKEIKRTGLIEKIVYILSGSTATLIFIIILL